MSIEITLALSAVGFLLAFLVAAWPDIRRNLVRRYLLSRPDRIKFQSGCHCDACEVSREIVKSRSSSEPS